MQQIKIPYNFTTLPPKEQERKTFLVNCTNNPIHFCTFSQNAKMPPGGAASRGHFVYSVRRATTGSFLAALREGMKPANTDRKMLIPTSTRAVCQGR